MNRKWIYRAVSGALLAGGMLLLGTGTANAGVPIAGGDAPVTVAPQRAGLAHPIMARRDPATQQPGTTGVAGQLQGLAGQVLPSRGMQMHPDTVFNESAHTTEGLPGVSTPSNQPPTNGTRVDVPQVTHAAGGLVQPVTQQAGPLAGPLNGITGGESATVTPLPVSAPGQVLPLGGTEGFTVGQNTKLPTDGLVGQVGSTVTQVVPGGDQAAQLTDNLSAPSGESATEAGPLGNLAGGANVAGLPAGDLTGPVADQVDNNPLTSQLTSGNLTGPTAGTEDTMSSGDQAGPTNVAGPTDPTDQQPAGPTGGLPGLGSNPLGPVTGLLGS